MERDLVIVGAGPAGITAAETARESGCRVTLIDENPSTGGQIWRGANPELGPSIEVLTGHSVVDATDRTLWLVNGSTTEKVVWRRLILATGARELFLPFPGWTLPGVLGVGGLQALSKTGLSLRDKRIVLAGSGPLIFAVAAHAVELGADVVAVVEQASLRRLIKFGVRAMMSSERRLQTRQFAKLLTPSCIKVGWWVAHAIGEDSLQSVRLTNGEECQIVEVDWLACSWGLVPNTDLARLLGAEVTDRGIAVTGELATSIQGIWAAGECTGVGGVERAIAEGRAAGLSATGRQADAAQLRANNQYSRDIATTYRIRPEVKALAGADEIICRCENVTCGEICSLTSMREARLYHRLGMGACQGRVCGAAASEIFGWRDVSIRTPLIPLPTREFQALVSD